MTSKKTAKSGAKAFSDLEERVNVLGRAVFGSENFGKAMNTGLAARTRLRKAFADGMGEGLHFYNMPSQDDVVNLAEQCARIEERVVRIERMLERLTEAAPEAAPKGPARTKRPTKKTSISGGAKASPPRKTAKAKA